MRDAHLHDAPEGRVPKGRRAYGRVPRNRGRNTTLIASMTLEGAMGEAMVEEGATDRFVVEAYVEHILAPTLEEGRMVLLDNLPAHKTDVVRGLIEARCASLWLLSPYSPDLNHVEEEFFKVKALLKKVAVRTKEALVEAIAEALSAVRPRDAESWFAHCGYELRDRPCEHR